MYCYDEYFKMLGFVDFNPQKSEEHMWGDVLYTCTGEMTKEMGCKNGIIFKQLEKEIVSDRPLTLEYRVGYKDGFESKQSQLESKAAKWDDPQTQADLELAQAVKAWFLNGHFIECSNVECWDEQDFINWYRNKSEVLNDGIKDIVSNV